MSDKTKFVPPTGMRDWLPQETLLRQKLIRLIESHYQLYGFQPIDTPVMENIEVLQGKGGGENEKLMFSVIRRGGEFYDAIGKVYFSKTQGKYPNQLDVEEMGRFKNDLSDMGLRFDLTVPLARYYANHANDLPKPFRCYHIGPVWRADRPQKGRYREFYQCDIDIVGGASEAYEVELLLATDRVLKELNVGKFKIRISHKDLLSSVLQALGVESQFIPKIAIAVDKLDKLPRDVVRSEIEKSGIPADVFESVWTNVIELSLDKWGSPYFIQTFLDTSLGKEIKLIEEAVLAVNPSANVVFDPLLVRGFDYYTGPVFEINVEDKDFNFSIGGGGRYDGLIEKLGGPKNTPAVGISLGFERILLILAEKNKGNYRLASSKVYVVWKEDKNEKDILALAEVLRGKGIQVDACLEKKDYSKQMKAAEEAGIQYSVEDFKLGSSTLLIKHLPSREKKEMSVEQLKEALEKAAQSTVPNS